MTLSPSRPPSDGLERSIQLMRLLGDQADAIWALLAPDEANRLRVAMESGENSLAPNDVSPDFWGTITEPQIPNLARLLERESPQIAAITLSKLSPDLAALLSKAFPERRAAAVLHRLAHLGPVQSAALQALERSLKAQLDVPLSQTAGGQAETVAEILDSLGGERERRLLAALDKKEAGLRKRIADHMFRFDDLVHLDPAGTQTLLSQLDRALLLTALKGAADETASHILKNMTKRAADLLQSELETTSPDQDEIEAAQRHVVRLLRVLTNRREILIDRNAERALVA